MKNKKFKARTGYPINDTQAQILGAFIAEKFPSGQLNPDDLVNAARPKNSPIHSFFDWDDKSAAEKYRRDQAMNYLRAIVVEVNGHDTPAYHRVYLEAQDTISYVDVKQTLASRDLWSQVIEGAMREAKAWSARYRNYKELGVIVDAINQTDEEIKRGNSKHN